MVVRRGNLRASPRPCSNASQILQAYGVLRLALKLATRLIDSEFSLGGVQFWRCTVYVCQADKTTTRSAYVVQDARLKLLGLRQRARRVLVMTRALVYVARQRSMRLTRKYAALL